MSLNTVLERVVVDRLENDANSSGDDWVAVETLVALEFNGISHAVMLASPSDLEDFALGFALTEGILKSKTELYDCDVIHQDEGIVVRMEIAAKRFVELKDRRRNLTGRTGCGLCGVETIEQAMRHPVPITHCYAIVDDVLLLGMQKMHQLQPIHAKCGATHAAAWMSLAGDITCVREDVGRHNALDKLMGALAKQGQDFSQGVVLITSRASYEMVQKSAVMGVGLIAAISAPTSLAAALAKDVGVTLMGYVRNKSYVVYSHPQRILKHQKTER
jgi:FdhD protein